MKHHSLSGVFRLLALGAMMASRVSRDLSERVFGGYTARHQRQNRAALIQVKSHERNRKKLAKRTDLAQKRAQQRRERLCLPTPRPRSISVTAARLLEFRRKHNLWHHTMNPVSF